MYCFQNWAMLTICFCYILFDICSVHVAMHFFLSWPKDILQNEICKKVYFNYVMMSFQDFLSPSKWHILSTWYSTLVFFCSRFGLANNRKLLKVRHKFCFLAMAIACNLRTCFMYLNKWIWRMNLFKWAHEVRHLVYVVCNRNNMTFGTELKQWYNIHTMLYHGISLVHFDYDSTKF